MKIAMIFEDNDKSKLGALLKRCFNGENLYFAGSNTRIFKEVKRVYMNYDIIIIFFDLVPNNPALNRNLIALKKKIEAYIKQIGINKEVHIIPTICMEFIYLRCLNNNGIHIPEIGFKNCANYPKTAEKYYKRIVERYSSIGEYIELESERFYASLPVFTIGGEEQKKIYDEHNIEYKQTSFNKVRETVTKVYCELYNVFGIDFNSELTDLGIELF